MLKSARLWKKVIQSLGGVPVLTVGESSGFCRWGGMVNFRLDGQNLRLEINDTAARQSGLRVSAQLLELATIVEREPE